MTSKSLPHHHTRKRIQYPWEVCILATSTPTILKRCTLHTLKECGIPASKITVFVQGKDEKQTFQDQLSQGTYNRIIASQDVGVTGLLRCIYSMYKVGTPLVLCRDSIEKIVQNTAPLKSLLPLFQSMFPLCTHEKVGLWGVYPVPKPTFLKDSVVKGVKRISGAMWGIYNPGVAGPEFSVTMETIPEIQSICQFSKAYGGSILRLNSVSVEWRPEKWSKQRDAELERIAGIYPEYVSVQRGSDGGLDVRLIQDKELE
jgi:hypothetical protein